MEKATSKETEESKKPRRRETSARGDEKESEKDPAPIAEGKQRCVSIFFILYFTFDLLFSFSESNCNLFSMNIAYISVFA